MENFNKGYNTYILGTSNNASTSLEILLYNKSDWYGVNKLPKLSLYNLSQVYSQIVSSEEKKYLILTRNSVEDSFYYNYKNEKILGFSVIIYINTVENSPIGYTEFLNIQGVSNNIDIHISFSSNISDIINVELVNSLAQLRNNTNIGKDFLSQDNLYSYPSKDVILDESSRIESYPRYTSNVYNLINNKETNILLSNGVISSNGFHKITFNNNVNIDPYSNSFKNHQLGVYGKDIVLYSWSGNKFSIHSLIKRTRFGNPFTYTTDNVDYNILDTLENNEEIFYFSGRFIITITNNFPSTMRLYDLERKIWIIPEYNNFFLDILDPRSIIYSIPDNVTSFNITNYIPEINNTFIDLSEFSKYSNIVILEKIGQWYVFKNKKSTTQDYNVYSSINKSVTTIRNKDVPIILNDNILMIRTVTENLDYYTVYLGDEIEYMTENARSIDSGIELEYDEELGIMFCNDSNSEIYRNYYKEGKIKIINRKNGIFGTLLEGFRKSFLRDNIDKEVPNIIGAFFGIIYYINEDNYLNYL